MKLHAILLFFILQFSLLTAASSSGSVDDKYSADTAISSENGQTAAFALSQAASHILGNETGNSWLFSWNADGRSSSGTQTASISGRFNHFTSTVPLLSGNASAGSVSGEAGNDFCSFSFDLQMAASDKLTITLRKPRFYLKNISFCSGKAGLTFNTPLILEPFVVFSNLASQNGSFYFFYGYASGTPVRAAGLNARYNSHTASLLYGTSHITVSESREDLLLATIDASFLNAGWSYKYKTGDWNFSSSLGYTGIFPNINLNLTKGNQKIIGFPFEFMDFTITGQMNILSFAQKNTLNLGNAHLSLDMAGLFCFYSDFNNFIQWQYKESAASLYRALFESLSITSGSSGHTKANFRNLQFTSILLPEIAYGCTIKNRSFTLDVSASKKFPLAFRFGDYENSVIETWTSDGKEFPLALDFANSLSAKDIFSSVTDYLLAGLTLSISINY